MTGYSRQEVISGLMIVLCVAGLCVLAMSVLNWRAWVTEHAVYHAEFDDVLGVGVGTPVLLRGIQCGTVAQTRREVRQEDDRQWEVVVLDLKVRRDVRLHQGITAAIEAPSLLKDPIVVLYQGEESAALLAHGDTMPGRPGASIGSLISRSTEMMESIQGMLGEDNQDRVTSILAGLEETANQARQLTEDLGPRIRLLLDDNVLPMTADLRVLAGDAREIGPKANEALDGVNSMVQKAQSALDDLQGGLDELVELLKAVTADARGLLARADGAVASVSDEAVVTMSTAQVELTRLVDEMAVLRVQASEVMLRVENLLAHGGPEVERIMENVEETSRHVEQLTRELKRSPWRLIWRQPPRRLPPPVEPEWELREPQTTADP